MSILPDDLAPADVLTGGKSWFLRVGTPGVQSTYL